MPRSFEMSWDAAQARWTKMYRGKRYTVACSVLGGPATKEGSYQLANEWWRKKRAEIDGTQAAEHPHAETLAELARKLGYANRHGLHDEAAAIARQTEAIQVLPHDQPAVNLDEQTNRLLDGIRLLLAGADNPAELNDPVLLQALNAVVGDGPVWADRFKREPAASPDKTVKTQVERWVGTQQALVASGNMSPDQCDNRRICLYHFRDWIGEAVAVDVIDAPKLHNFYLWCLGKVQERQRDKGHKQGWSGEYAKKVFNTARAFVRFLWEQGLVELPNNINSKNFRFGNGAKAVQTWTKEEVQWVIKESPGKLKLALLLMVNCGFGQSDVSDLLDSEVDWTAGRINRKRSKTGDWENVPLVSYKLWPLTVELLTKYRSGEETVLLTESGLPYVRKELVNGKLIKADGIASNYTHVKNRLGFKKPLKLLRKTVATMLESHPTYGRFTSHFLGHSPATIKDKHYAAPSQPLFDEAVLWLGRELGLA
jgi:integrase